MSKIHELKIYPQYFRAVLDGSKTFEFRKDDRGFEVGDTLILKEFIPETIDHTAGEPVIKESRYTGRTIKKKITYILKDGVPGCRLRDGLVILALGEEEKEVSEEAKEQILKEYAEDLYEEFSQVARFEEKITMKDVTDILQLNESEVEQ